MLQAACERRFAFRQSITAISLDIPLIRETLVGRSSYPGFGFYSMATVYKRGKTWWVRYQWHGQEVRRSAHTSSKMVAQQYLARLLAENQRVDRGGRPRRTYEETLQRFWLEYLPTLKVATQSRYRSSFRQLDATFKAVRLDEITRDTLSTYVSGRLRTGSTPATVRRDLTALSSLCSCAVAWDYSDANPVKLFSKRHLRESPPRTCYPSAEDVERLIHYASPMLGRIIRLLAETGMRLEEACGLEWHQVSVARRELRLTKTKTSSPRVVPLSDLALGTLVGTPRHRTSPYVFWHDDGVRYTNVSGIYRKVARRAHVPFRCHDLRHRFASVFAQQVGDLAALQAILGHRSIQMTMRYSHLMTEHLHRAMARNVPQPGTLPGAGATVSNGITQSDDNDALSEPPLARR